jgi:hypothetical protein
MTRTVTLSGPCSGVEGSRELTSSSATGFLDFARNERLHLPVAYLTDRIDSVE